MLRPDGGNQGQGICSVSSDSRRIPFPGDPDIRSRAWIHDNEPFRVHLRFGQIAFPEGFLVRGETAQQSTVEVPVQKNQQLPDQELADRSKGEESLTGDALPQKELKLHSHNGTNDGGADTRPRI